MSEEKKVTRWSDLAWKTGIQPNAPRPETSEWAIAAERAHILALRHDHPKRIELIAQMAERGEI